MARQHNQGDLRQGSHFSRDGATGGYSQRQGRAASGTGANQGHATRAHARHHAQGTAQGYTQHPRTSNVTSGGTSRAGAAQGAQGAQSAQPRTTQGYRAPSSNPYLAGGATPGASAQGFTPVRAGRQTRKRVSAQKRLVSLAIIVVIFAAIGGVAAYTWLNRSVSIVLNGTDTQVKIGSTFEQIIESKGLSITPGNLVSVSGNVLTEGGGDLYSASVDGEALSYADAQKFHVEGDESITLTAGADVTEAYDVTQQTVEPKLEMDGSWGSVTYIAQWPKAGITETRVGKISGETVEGEVVQEVQNCIVKCTMVTPDNGQKLVALTFDDGPSAYTQKYLDILAQYGAKATFFVLGDNIGNYPEAAKAIVSSGNQIASHTGSHSELTTLDAATLQQELRETFDKINTTTGVQTTIFRPPYGEFTQRTWLNSGGVASVSVLWTQDSLDWKLPGASAIVSNCLSNITSGSIILMHDGGGNRDQDVQALPTLISTLQEQGYTLVTLDELLASDSSIPADIASGNATMPADATWPTELA